MAAINQSKLRAAYLKWKGLRQTLTGVQRREFHRWATTTYPEFREVARQDARLFLGYCQELVRNSSVDTPDRVSDGLLMRHIVPLAQLFVEVKDRRSLEAFFDEVRSRCATERALLRYLRQAKPNSR